MQKSDKLKGMCSSNKKPQMQENFTPIVLGGFYIFCALLSNILSLKLVTVPLVHCAVDGGTILYPLAFVLRDMLHKNVGRRLARHTIIYTGGLMLLMVLLIQLVVVWPAPDDWTLQQAFSAVFASTSRIVIAGITMQVLSNLINTFLFSYGLRNFPKYDIIVSFLSNAISLFVDTVGFCILAFGGLYSWPVVCQIIAVNLVFKVFTALVFAPLVHFIRMRVKLDQI